MPQSTFPSPNITTPTETPRQSSSHCWTPLSLSLSILLWSGLTSNVFSGVKLWLSVLSLLCPALRTSQQSLVGGWGGSRQIFYHNYLLNQAVIPTTSHSPPLDGLDQREEREGQKIIIHQRRGGVRRGLTMPLISCIN